MLFKNKKEKLIGGRMGELRGGSKTQGKRGVRERSIAPPPPPSTLFFSFFSILKFITQSFFTLKYLKFEPKFICKVYISIKILKMN